MKIQELRIYPVKGCAGISVSTSRVQHRGLEFDRRWMVVDENGVFISQRTLPAMAKVKLSVEGAGIKLQVAGLGATVVRPEDKIGEAEVVVWRSTVQAHVVSKEADELISSVLEMPVRLVHMPNEARRETYEGYRKVEGIVSFADAFPILVANQASLEHLNSELETPVPINRFRPNVVVAGSSTAWEEDEWYELDLGTNRFLATKVCARCSVTTVDQQTGEPQGAEPLRTLARLHLRNQQAIFGTYIVPVAECEISVGDEVTVVERAPVPVTA